MNTLFVLTISLLVFSQTLWAAISLNDSVRFNINTGSPENPLQASAGTASGSSTLTLGRLVSESPTNDGTDPSAPGYLYVPYIYTADLKSSYRVQADRDSIPTSSSGFVQLPLTVTTGGSGRFIQIAAKSNASGTPWMVLRLNDDQTNQARVDYGSGNTSINLKFWIDSGTNHLYDSNIINNDFPSNNIKTVSLYIFSAVDGYTLSSGSTLTPSTANYGNGVYLNLYLSNKVPDAAVTLNEARPGDRRAILEYYTNSTIDQHYKTVVLDYSATATAPQAATSVDNAVSITGLNGQFVNEYDPQLSSLIANNLTNNRSYNLAVAQMDKFLVLTNISNSKFVSTEPIDVVLQKKACFLVTAGFQEEHYILDFYRMVRDRYLLRTQLGRGFVDNYYRFSPPLAQIIIAHPFLAWCSRSFFTLLYWLLSTPLLFISLSILGIILTLLLVLIKTNNPFQKKVLNVK